MEKYIPSGLKRKDGTDIMCLSYEYYLAHPEEFKYEERKTKESKADILQEELEEYKIENNKIHDKLFKDLFSNKEETVKFINKYLNLRIPLEVSMLEVYKTEFVTNLYTTKEADIVYKVKNKNVFFLIEHQSKPDRSMPFRLNEYATYIMRQAVEKSKMQIESYKYPKVIKIVLYTGEETWNAKLTLEEIQDSLVGYKETKEDYTLVDINTYTREELLEDNLIITKAMLIEKSRTKEEMIKNYEAIARTVIGRKMLQGEYLLKIMEKHILPLNLRKEANELVEKIKKERGEDRNMLAVLEMIERENQSYIMMGRKEGKIEANREVALKLLKRKMAISEISEITGLAIEEIEKIKKFLPRKSRI